MTKSVVINVRSMILIVFRPAGGNLVLATEWQQSLYLCVLSNQNGIATADLPRAQAVISRTKHMMPKYRKVMR